MATPHPHLIEKDQRTSSLSLAEHIPDLNKYAVPTPAIFWLDFLGCVLVTDIFMYLAVKTPSFSLLQLGYIVFATLFLFRSSVFIHEAVHTGKQIPFFELGYNLAFGFVHKFPLYIYHPHRFHHVTEMYGTKNDPEYDLLKGRPVDFIIPVISQLFTPLLLILRFGFFPLLLPFIGEKGRNTVYQYASTFELNLKYVRALPSAEERREWYVQDAACGLYNAVFFGLMISGIWSWKVLFVWYAALYLSFVINFYRVMASHTYLSNFEPTSRKLQILDSITLTGSRALEWLYPVGLRYHALHHMVPHVPYHNLGRLHRTMLAVLPADHPYRETFAPTYRAAARKLTR